MVQSQYKSVAAQLPMPKYLVNSAKNNGMRGKGSVSIKCEDARSCVGVEKMRKIKVIPGASVPNTNPLISQKASTNFEKD